MVNGLEFEKPVLELRKKITELKEFTKDSDVDFSAEIDKLESRLEELENECVRKYVAMGPCASSTTFNRPTTLDYIELLFTDFFELHGDQALWR